MSSVTFFILGSRLFYSAVIKSSDFQDSVGSILAKTSTMRVTIPIDLSTRSFITLPRFFNSRRVPPLLNQSIFGLNSGTVCLSGT